MAAKILFHIGLHKTATTSLQVDTFPNVVEANYLPLSQTPVRNYIDHVLACDPIYYPSTSRVAGLGNLLDEQKLNLISSEALSGPAWVGVAQRGIDHRTPVLQNLSHDFPDAEVLVILRRQDAYARSMYRQYVKAGGSASMARFLGANSNDVDDADNAFAPLFARNRFYYTPYIRALKQHFRGAVHVLFFEQIATDPAAFMSQLASILGSSDPIAMPGRRNSSRLGSRGLWMSRQLNRLFRNALNPDAPLPGLPRRRNGKWISVSPVTLLQDHWPGKAPVQSPQEQSLCESLLKSCHDDNVELATLLDTDLSKFRYY